MSVKVENNLVISYDDDHYSSFETAINGGGCRIHTLASIIELGKIEKESNDGSRRDEDVPYQFNIQTSSQLTNYRITNTDLESLQRCYVKIYNALVDYYKKTSSITISKPKPFDV